MARQIKIIHDLSIKQFVFVKSLLEGNSGIQSALKAYNTSDPNVAKVIASQNLRKLNIQQAIREILDSEGLTVSKIVGNITKIASSQPNSITGDSVLKANLEMLKLIS